MADWVFKKQRPTDKNLIGRAGETNCKTPGARRQLCEARQTCKAKQVCKAKLMGSGPRAGGRSSTTRSASFRCPIFVILFAVIAGFAAHRQSAIRYPDGDRPAVDGRLYLRRTGQANSDHPQYRRGGDLRHFHPVLSCIPSFVAGLDPGFGQGLHQGFELSVPVHFLHHRRQHPGNGSRRPDQGLPQDIRSAGRGLARRRSGRNAGRRPARPRRLPHVLLRRGPDHGRRRGRRRDSALDRLFADPSPAAGRPVRAGIAAGDAGQPDGHSAVGHAQLCRQEVSASDRRGTPATGRA